MPFGFGMGFTRNDPFAGGPSLNLQFAGNTVLDPSITFTRGSNATQFDSSGNLVYAPNNAIRNNTMVGAVAGTPGTLPTNWAIGGVTTGLTISVVGTGIESGITYIDIRFNGTAGAALNPNILFDTSTGIAAANGQTWAWSSYVSLVGGSLTNVTGIIAVQSMFSSVPTLLGTLPGSPFVPTGAALNTQRQTFAGTLNQATTAFVRPQLQFSVANGAAIDITLRIGLPQLEIGPTATAVNRTSGTAYYGPRFDYDPSTLAPRGLLIEEARTNSIRNNTMQGAVAGTPGTVPTNWALGGISGGLATQVVGTGTENGITYIDIRIFGTNSSGSSVFPGVFFDTTTGIAGTTGQVWSESVYLSLAAGTGVNFELAVHEADSGGVFLRSTVISGTGGSPTSGALNTRRRSGAITLGASTAFVRPVIATTVTNGSSIDITLRIGLPQLEQGAFATSVIPTTTTALTRNADVASVNTLSPWYNASEGTIYAEATARLGITQGLAVFEGTAGAGMRVRKNSANQYSGVLREPTNRDINLTPSPALTEGQIIRQALAIKANDCALSGGGQSPGTQTTFTIPTVTAFAIGGSTGAGEPFANSWIRRITYYPRRLSNAELQAITS